MNIEPLILTGNFVTLEPFTEAHRDILKIIAQDERLWVYSPFSGMGDKFDAWFDNAMEGLQNGEQYPFAVRRLSDKKIIGTTRYYDINHKHRRLGIGYTWYIPEVWGSAVNPECKYLLLNQAFTEWKFNRIAFLIDSRNQHSIAAVKKLGAKEEGVLRQHMVVKDGHIRDTVVLSIIKSEWPAIRLQLQNRLTT